MSLVTEPHRLPEFDHTSDRKRYPPAHAATVIVARDSPEGMAVLMTRRASQSAFGGMWVFPGGKVDADKVLRLALVALRPAGAAVGVVPVVHQHVGVDVL